MSAAVSAVG